MTQDPREAQRQADRGWERPESYRPPEKYEEWLSGDEDERKIIPVGLWLVCGLIGWVIFAWIIVVRYW